MEIITVIIASLAVHVSQGYEVRISGGVNSTKGEFPFVVSLQLFGLHYCAGSLLNDRWILTAARCALPFDTEVVAGEYNMDVTESSEQPAVANVSILHPGYNYEEEYSPNDIALLKLATPLTFNYWVQPIRLPLQGETLPGNVTLVGWGETEGQSISWYSMAAILQKVDLTLLNSYECRDAISKLNINVSLDAKTEICTGPLTGGFSACNGDSGDPLLQTDTSGSHLLVGVTSWPVKPCGKRGAPTVHTRVSEYIDWITSTMLRN